MKVWRRVLSMVLSVVMVTSLLTGFATEKHTASAAPSGTTDKFTAEEFRECYAKVLLSAVGRGYENGTGYGGAIRENGHAGTPRDPYEFGSSATFDCFGLVVAGLMAMGYDSIGDESYYKNNTGWHKDLNGTNGSNIFRGTNGLFYTHATGDTLVLHHGSDQKYTMTLKVGTIINVTTVSSLQTGTLLFSLPTDRESHSYTTGSFAKNTIGTGDANGIGHAAVALFSLPRDDNDTITPQNYSSYTTQQRADILATSWDNAQAELNKNGAIAKDLSGGSVRSSGSNFVPYLWDARGRGWRAASATSYKSGFLDPNAAFHFTTPYSRIWLIDALNTTVGVSVNNNPYGKSPSVTMAVDLIPQDQEGDIIITKTDKDTGAKLTGAEFALYEWSEDQGRYIVSPNYKIMEVPGNAGTYQVYDKRSNDQKRIALTEDNNACVRVIETKAPAGHSNIDPATGSPYQWDHQFTENGQTVSWTLSATNYADVGYQIVKTDEKTGAALAGGVFTLYSDANCTTAVADANGHSTFTTNASGQANVQFHLNVAQTYYMKETSAPTGYTVNGSKWRIVVAAAATGTITISEQAAGSSTWTTVTNITAANAKQLTTGKLPVGETGESVGFRAIKRDATDNTKLLSGAKFTLYSNEACNATATDATGTSVFTTNTSGQADLKFNLQSSVQTYYFKETQAPPDYEADGGIWKITVEKASVGSIKIEKKAAGASSYTTVANITAENAKRLTAGIIYIDEQPSKGSLSIKKEVELSEKSRTFWFKITGPDESMPVWKSVTVAAGATSGTVDIESNRHRIDRGDFNRLNEIVVVMRYASEGCAAHYNHLNLENGVDEIVLPKPAKDNGLI